MRVSVEKTAHQKSAFSVDLAAGYFLQSFISDVCDAIVLYEHILVFFYIEFFV